MSDGGMISGLLTDHFRIQLLRGSSRLGSSGMTHEDSVCSDLDTGQDQPGLEVRLGNPFNPSGVMGQLQLHRPPHLCITTLNVWDIVNTAAGRWMDGCAALWVIKLRLCYIKKKGRHMWISWINFINKPKKRTYSWPEQHQNQQSGSVHRVDTQADPGSDSRVTGSDRLPSTETAPCAGSCGTEEHFLFLVFPVFPLITPSCPFIHIVLSSHRHLLWPTEGFLLLGFVSSLLSSCLLTSSLVLSSRASGCACAHFFLFF